jgi:hypothetical protein
MCQSPVFDAADRKRSHFFFLASRLNTGTTVAPMTRRQPATNTRFFDRRKTSPEQFSTNFHDTGMSLLLCF